MTEKTNDSAVYISLYKMIEICKQSGMYMDKFLGINLIQRENIGQYVDDNADGYWIVNKTKLREFIKTNNKGEN